MEDPIKCEICGDSTCSLYRHFGTDEMRCAHCLQKELKKADREEEIEIDRSELLDFE